MQSDSSKAKRRITRARRLRSRTLPTELILRPLRAYARYRVDRELGFEEPLRRLTAQPRSVRPVLGTIPHLPPAAGVPAVLGLPASGGVSAVPKPTHYLPRCEDLAALKGLLLGGGTRETRAASRMTNLRFLRCPASS